MKRLDLWEVLGSAEMCAGVPEALQTPNPTQWLQECPQDMEHRGWLLPQPLRAQIFVFCAVLGYRGDLLVCVPSLSRLWGRDISGLRRRPQLPVGVAATAVLAQGSICVKVPEQREAPTAVIPGFPGPAPALTRPFCACSVHPSGSSQPRAQAQLSLPETP